MSTSKEQSSTIEKNASGQVPDKPTKTTKAKSATKSVSAGEKPVVKKSIKKEKIASEGGSSQAEALKSTPPTSETAVSEVQKVVVPAAPLIESAPPAKLVESSPELASKLSKPVATEDDRLIHLKPPIIVKELAARMSVKPFQLISDLMQLKILVSINQPIEPEIARKLCEKHGFKLELERRGEHPVKVVEAPKEEVKLAPEILKTEKLISRPPVVTIMGHVDHGKTSLLDAIRKTNVVAGEAGGITQHIGAYSVAVPSSDKKAPPRTITFIDTPGHEAFTAMRARGAHVTDIVILVVAASEGMMPQTIEALQHARAASVPIIVALTKMDLEAAQKMKDRVKKQLQEHDLASEDWGGKTITVEVSATKKTGIDQLLEMILLQSEVMELKAQEDCLAEGVVIEAQMESGRGPTATVLIRQGTLHLGEPFIVGPFWGKAKALLDDKVQMIKQAGPSSAVKITGISGIPAAGAILRAMKSEIEARDNSEQEQEKLRAVKLEGPKRLTLQDLLTSTSDQRKILKIILKTDVQGSCEAIAEVVSKLPQDKINVEIIYSGVGTITETDVLLATASKAIIVGFQVKVDSTAAEVARNEGIQIFLFRIIYELVDKIREFMAGLLDPEFKLTSLGTAEIRQVFDVSKGGKVAGCLVTQGRIERKGRVRVLRRRNVIFEGAITTLRRFQDEVSEVRTGLECGIRLENFYSYEPGDIIEVYHLEKVAQKL